MHEIRIKLDYEIRNNKNILRQNLINSFFLYLKQIKADRQVNITNNWQFDENKYADV